MTTTKRNQRWLYIAPLLFVLFSLANCNDKKESEAQKKLYGKWTETNRVAKCADSLKTESLNATASTINYKDFSYEFLSSGKVLTKTSNSQDTKNYKVEGDTLIWNSDGKGIENNTKDRLEFISDTKLTLTSKMADSCIITSTFEKNKQ